MRLQARVLGEGAPVLLLHGLFGSGRNFGGLQVALATTHRVAAFDLRNHGGSPHAPGMEYPALAADVAETIDALGLAGAAVIGHSMGGKVAMRLALDHPALVARLVVADIAPAAYAGSFAAYAAAMRGLALAPGLTRTAAMAALAAAVPDAGVRGFLLLNLQFGDRPAWKIGLDEIIAGLADILDWPATEASYPGPAWFVNGALSDYVTPAHHPEIRRLFPAARFATLDNAGHWLHADQPAAFLATVQDALTAP